MSSTGCPSAIATSAACGPGSASGRSGVPVERDARAGGTPSYTLGKLLRLGFDGIFAFSVAPLRAAWLFGAIASALASLYALYAVFQRLFLGTSPQGFTALIVAITFFAGVQLLFLGLIGEYLGRVYDESKGRPHFVVTDTVSLADDRRRAPEAPAVAPTNEVGTTR